MISCLSTFMKPTFSLRQCIGCRVLTCTERGHPLRTSNAEHWVLGLIPWRRRRWYACRTWGGCFPQWKVLVLCQPSHGRSNSTPPWIEHRRHLTINGRVSNVIDLIRWLKLPEMWHFNGNGNTRKLNTFMYEIASFKESVLVVYISTLYHNMNNVRCAVY